MILKDINISENRILRYISSADGGIPNISIEEMFIGTEQEPSKSYTFSKWHDYGLNGWYSGDDEIERMSFDIEQSHPLFLPLLHLLKGEDSLVIDDDMTREDNKKYISISKVEEKIQINIVNSRGVHSAGEEFCITVINVFNDGRSKIDQQFKDTKERLAQFFREAYNAIFGWDNTNSEEKGKRREFKIDPAKPQTNIEGEE